MPPVGAGGFSFISLSAGISSSQSRYVLRGDVFSQSGKHLGNHQVFGNKAVSALESLVRPKFP